MGQKIGSMETPMFPAGNLTLDPNPLPPALGNCLVCGQGNPHGLRLRFHRLIAPDGTAIGVGADSTVPAYFQGFDDLLHGGVICAMLDDAMWWAVYVAHKAITVTADMQLRYREPVSTGSALRIEGIVGAGRRIYPAAARMLDASGRVVAEATARFVALPAAKAERLRF
jgi:hypothetical protein